MAQPDIHMETMTTERTGKSDVERGEKNKQYVDLPELTLLFVSRGGSWEFRQACATLITCSSFRGCSSTFAAKNKVVGDIICTKSIETFIYKPILFNSVTSVTVYLTCDTGCRSIGQHYVTVLTFLWNLVKEWCI